MNDKKRFIVEEIVEPFCCDVISGGNQNNLNSLLNDIQEYLDRQLEILKKDLEKILPAEIKNQEKDLRVAFQQKKLIKYLWDASQKNKKKFEETLQLLKEMEEVGYLWH